MTDDAAREQIRRRARDAIAAAQVTRNVSMSPSHRKAAAQRTEARLEREHAVALAAFDPD